MAFNECECSSLSPTGVEQKGKDQFAPFVQCSTLCQTNVMQNIRSAFVGLPDIQLHPQEMGMPRIVYKDFGTEALRYFNGNNTRPRRACEMQVIGQHVVLHKS